MQERRREETCGWCEMSRRGKRGMMRDSSQKSLSGLRIPASCEAETAGKPLRFGRHTIHKHTFVQCCVINIQTLSSIRSDIYSQVALKQSNG